MSEQKKKETPETTKVESPKIPNVAYPLKPRGNVTNLSQQYFNHLAGDESARFLFNNSGLWHQGIHLRASKFPSSEFENDKICAIADGKLIAYKVDSEYKKDNSKAEAPMEGAVYSTGYFLVKHEVAYPKDNVLTFYSLYRHTAKLSDYKSGIEKIVGVTKSADNKIVIRDAQNHPLNPRVELNNGVTIGVRRQTQTQDKFDELLWYRETKDNKTIEHKPKTGERWRIFHQSYEVEQSQSEQIKGLPLLSKHKIDTQADVEVKLDKPIEIKAGEVLGLMGEYNQAGESGEKLLHLEVFTYDNIEQFKAKAEAAYKQDREKKGIKDNFLYVARGSQLYTVLKNEVIELEKSQVEIMVPLADVAKQTVKKKTDKTGKDYYNVQPYLYSLLENNNDGGIYVDDSHLTHGLLFPGVNVFKDEAHEVSIFKEKIATCADPEGTATPEEKDRLGPVFKEIWQELDVDKDSRQGEVQFEAGTLKALLTNPIIRRRLTGIIVRHKSEWSAEQEGKFEELKALMRKNNCAEKAERFGKRVADLGIKLKGEGFDSEQEAYYMHPLGLIGWLATSKGEKRCFCYEQGLMSSPCLEGTPVLEQHYEALSEELGVEKEVLKAVAEVESKGKGFISLNGERRAKILYERHYMYRKLAKKKSNKYDLNKLSQENPNIVNKSVQPRGTYSSEEYQYEKLAIAKNIDNDSAIQSCSWGKFQVMGSYYSYGGYATPTEFEEAMHLCELQQFVYFKNFLSKVSPKIIKPMREKNWAIIAEIYNGPDYSTGAYDTKMRNAYNKYIALKNK